MLGFEKRRKFEESVTYSGEKAVDFANINLEQINSSNSYFNGAQGMLLYCIPIEDKEFGDIVPVRFEHPELKKLIYGTISEFSYKVRDKNGEEIIIIYL